MNFLHNVRLALTPLSPIHIGCGEDFEPTHYVINDAILYGFDPARAALPDTLSKRLGELGEKAAVTERAAAQAQEEARQAADAERLARLQTLSANLHAVETFIDDCTKQKAALMGKKEKANTTYHTKANALAKKAHEEAGWTPEEKTKAADAIEHWLPQIVAVEAKDLRKKLKLAVLRGAS